MALPWLIGGAVLLGIAALSSDDSSNNSSGGDNDEEERRRREAKARAERARREREERRQQLKNNLTTKQKEFLDTSRELLENYFVFSQEKNQDLDLNILDNISESINRDNREKVKENLLMVEQRFQVKLKPTKKLMTDIDYIKSLSKEQTDLLEMKKRLEEMKDNLESSNE